MHAVDIRARERDEIHETLINLLRLHADGCLRGIVFGLVLDNGDYRIGVKGTPRRHPIEALGLFARGTATANSLLTEHLQSLVSVE
ncbi:hypothetical protein ACKZDW_09090 [Ralstonia syzygii subsp. celebesensis]|uniref:Uncharacterized protein n=2 Tax=Ralstonia syzygii subsp. celebesensis TaxID=1310168 RepID=A0A1U9VF60_9RALS|nr:hypothetical protein [Ralstonia syzygii]AQW28827.1 hypothetical protein B0B51_01540 [blood disease bacterium A2-HR MARDI]QQV54623.1 hypothetical protein JK151_10595 [Ralstonia syzygii subsp. celebesensis]CCA79076.1 hypothetical protein BDB_40029 [blood disease bacterium R229]